MDLNSTKELISEIKKGNMVLLMDDEDRENEGDLILAGEKVNPEKINFMAKHARGLICLAMSQSKCEALNLNQMVNDNKSGHGTGFTVSIEAATGITTGISAADRARTIAVASKAKAKARKTRECPIPALRPEDSASAQEHPEEQTEVVVNPDDV